jgi:hypothetical protein
VKGIHPATVFHVEIDLCEREWVFVSKGLGQTLGPEKKQGLAEIENKAEQDVCCGQTNQYFNPKNHDSYFCLEWISFTGS